jgi:KUP system potassium uptake protein
MSDESPASHTPVADAATTGVLPPHDRSGPIRAVPPGSRRDLALASLGALGVVYGDIGTSPLYAIRECLAWRHSPHAVEPTLPNVLGVLSLVFWALVLVICVKYLVFVLRADNRGEGGILALAALVEGREGTGRATKLGIPVLLGLFGAGLLFGDGAITPAISVLGAIEGLSERSPAFEHLIVPITAIILIGLFFVQRHGTGRIGFAFGPVILIWFIAIGAIGVRWIAERPSVLLAVNPIHGVRFLAEHGYIGFLIVGLVFLVVTGGEALYADMGHFGKTPIRIAWFAVALPGLLLNYFGQGALLLVRPPGSVKNPFYAAAEGPLLVPMLVLATLAAVIASQALISGVFSLTRQAMQLGFWPRLTVVHTSAKAEGQIYIPEMNYLLMAGCLALVFQFGSSSNLAAAYGVAVTATMAITSYLLYLVCRRRWGYTVWAALALVVPFLAIDVAFFSANAVKILHGGWFPLTVGLLVFTVMTTWWRGRVDLARMMETMTLDENLFVADIASSPPHRVKGTAVFLTSGTKGVPNLVLHHIEHNQVLHEQVVLLSVLTEPSPWVRAEKGTEVRDLGQGFFRVMAHIGFMQTPNVPDLLAGCRDRGIAADPMTTTYYLGRETLLTTGSSSMAPVRKHLFSFLSRNARPPSRFFGLPPNRVVELGTQIEL